LRSVKPAAIALSVCLALIAVVLPAPAEETSNPAGRKEQFQNPGDDSRRKKLAFPAGHLQDLYIADPHRPGAGLLGESYFSTDVEQATDYGFYLKVGGRFGLLRWLPKTDTGRMWQVSLEAGLDAQFDGGSSLENTGWDGNYGLVVSTIKRGGRWAYKTGILHTSAHIGDEWIERTGRQRIGYTREEALAAVSWQFAPKWRTYVEGAWGYELRVGDDLMAPLRGQVGLELELPERMWNGLAGWYAATDISSWEERDWRIDVSLQVGLRMTNADRTWRLGLQYYDGRVPLGEFFQETVSVLTIGLWSEL
jgi:hypothetical protein